MIKNYFKIAFRNLFKQKGLAFINIIGLSIGLACFSLFLFFGVHEFSFDGFHKDNDQLYRVYRWTADLNGKGERQDPYLPLPFGSNIKDEFPDIEKSVRWKEAWGESFVKINGKISRAELSHADDSFFDVFSFPLKYGTSESALADPKNVVLTEATALRLFGESNPTGKIIEIKYEDEFESFTVSGVVENTPTNSSIQFQMVSSMTHFEGTKNGKRGLNNWRRSFLNVFVKLRNGSGLATNDEALAAFRRKYYPDTETKLKEKGLWKGEGVPITYRLQPLNEIHTNAEIPGGEVAAVDPQNIWILLLIATGILLIAIINFTTLSIGRSASRAKEVGIRKVIGSNRKQLARQFLTESILLSFISAIVGLALAYLFLPFFNEFSGRELSYSFQTFPEMVWLLIGVTLLTGLIAGSYPAFMLSGFQPIEVFKNKIKLGGSNWFTKSLVTTQFVLSSGFVIATLVIINQLDFLQSSNPGFDKENVIVIDAEGTNTSEVYPLFREDLKQNPSIVGIAASELGLGGGQGWSQAGFPYKGETKDVYEYYVDDDYINVMGIELLAGRDFQIERQDDVNRSVIVNESMVNDFGWTMETAVGQELTGYFEEGNDPRVIGVVKDFHFLPFSENVRPQMFHQYEDYAPFKFFVRIKEGDPAQVLASLDASWNKVAGGLPFKYSFLDEDLNRFYSAEKRIGSIIGWAGFISIFLACLGLIGLTALSSANRNKEIGIRKVLGASVANIIGMLSKDFIKLVILALVISIPITWYFMNDWLNDFAYHIDLDWKVFALAGVLAIGIAVVTVGLQSLRAALNNPADSLKNE